MCSIEESLGSQGKLPEIYRRLVEATLIKMPDLAAATVFLDTLTCRAGEIFSSERSHRKTFSRHLEFFMQWKTEERKKVLPRG